LIAIMQAVHRSLGTWSRMIDVFIAVSEFMRRKLIQGGISRELVRVKPNFLPDPGIGDRKRDRAVFVGRLSIEKGLSSLLDAWRDLPDIPLDIIGSGPLEGSIRREVRAASLTQVTVRGHLSHAKVIEAVQGARMSIMPTLAFEGLPMTMIEAFACGTPVIASSIGAVQEMMSGNQAGAAFRPGDSRELAALVRGLWPDSKRLATMAAAAREEYERAYKPETNYSQLMEVYRSLLP
jgi:glycosyltransferase involved in cell wall biosynthesis